MRTGSTSPTISIPRVLHPKIGLLLFLAMFCGSELYAQLANKAQEIWPAVDVYYRLNPRIRFYSTVSGTKMSESSYSDGAFGIFFDYFSQPIASINKVISPWRSDSLPGKFLWLRVGYQYSASPPSAKDPFRENMLVTEANSRFYLPWNILMSLKNRFDWRVKNGEFNGRYRPRIMFEKDLRTEYMFFTISAFGEYFVNFDNADLNRFRTQIGIEFKVTKQINTEIYWNHQFANQPEVSDVDAMGFSLKFYLNHKKRKTGGN